MENTEREFSRFVERIRNLQKVSRAQADIKDFKYRLRRRDHIRRVVEGDFVGWMDKEEAAVHKPATEGYRKARLDPF